MRNYFKYIIFVVLLLAIVLTTFLLVPKEKEIETSNYISEVLIVDNDMEYEIKVNLDENNTVYRENGQEKIIYNYSRTVKPRIPFPDLKEIQGENTLKDVKPYISFTYNLNYNKGCQYLKYLVDEGYNVDMYISTSQYLEVFLLKDNKYKRLVLFKDSLMVCDMKEDAEKPPVWKYLTSYNFNSFIEKNFDVEI